MVKGKKASTGGNDQESNAPLVDDIVYDKPLVDDNDVVQTVEEIHQDGGAVVTKKPSLEKILAMLKKGDVEKATHALEDLVQDRRDKKNAREPSAFNLFVKEKMAELKGTNPNMSTKERMGLCAKLWKDHKEGK